MTLVTHQTGPHGKMVKRLYVEEGSTIERELYLSAAGRPRDVARRLVASTEGGMEIEEVAAKTPGKDHQRVGRSGDRHHAAIMARKLAFGLELSTATLAKHASSSSCRKLYTAFIANDMRMLEINPLVVTSDGRDARARRQGRTSTTTRSTASRISWRCATDRGRPEGDSRPPSYDLTYITLDGNIGCMVNGAGLAMATMDIIKLYGGSPANFLDVGGGATKEKVTAAFKIILSDPNVKAFWSTSSAAS